MRRVPDDAGVLDQKSLRRFMADSEAFGNDVGQTPVFNDEDDPGFQACRFFSKAHELVMRFIADRALRAMLENKNGIGFGLL